MDPISPMMGDLTITVIRAASLVAGDVTGKSDPYVVVSVQDAQLKKLSKFKTKVKKKTLQPCWGEEFCFTIDRPHPRLYVRFSVYDQDVGKDDFLGTATVEITSASSELFEKQKNLTLMPKNADQKVEGYISIMLSYKPSDVPASPVNIGKYKKLATSVSKPPGLQTGTEEVKSLQETNSKIIPTEKPISWTLPLGVKDLLSQLTPDLFFHEALLKVTVVEGENVSNASPLSTYVTISIYCEGQIPSKSKSPLLEPSTSPKWNFSWEDMIQEVGTKLNPTVLEVAVWNSDKNKPTILGFSAIPVVNFADHEFHDFQLELATSEGTTSDWKIRVQVLFESTFSKWSTNKKVEEEYAEYCKEKGVQEEGRVLGVKEMWQILDRAVSRAVMDSGSPEGIAERIMQMKITKEELIRFQKTIMEPGAVKWLRKFIKAKGIYYLFDYVRFYILHAHSPAHEVGDEEKEIFNGVIECIAKLKTYPELFEFDHMRVLVSCFDLLEVDMICLVLEALAKACIVPEAAVKVTDAMQYLIHCYASQWKWLLTMLWGDVNILFKLYLLQTVNVTLITTKDKTTQQQLGDFYINKGLTHEGLTKLLKHFADHELKERVNEFIGLTETTKSAESKVDLLMKENYKLKRKIDKTQKIVDIQRQEITKLNELLGSIDVVHVGEQLNSLRNLVKSQTTEINNLHYDREDLTEELEKRSQTNILLKEICDKLTVECNQLKDILKRKVLNEMELEMEIKLSEDVATLKAALEKAVKSTFLQKNQLIQLNEEREQLHKEREKSLQEKEDYLKERENLLKEREKYLLEREPLIKEAVALQASLKKTKLVEMDILEKPGSPEKSISSKGSNFPIGHRSSMRLPF